MSEFEKMLEDARYEVSIELYPRGVHYQIYKPNCPERHCWEVYRNPRSEDIEVEVTTCADTLEEALAAMKNDFASRFMNDRRWREYSDAVDDVCGMCIYTTGMECKTCLVRKSMDYYREARSKA